MTRQEFINGVEHSQRSLRRFLASLCMGDTRLAEDIAQETYMKAYMASEKFKNPEKFKFWVFKIAYNTFLTHKRDRKHEWDISEAKSIKAETNEEPFQYETLYQALASLPERERTAVSLFYLEGYASKEIATLLDISDDAVRQAIGRGRKRLKTLIR